MHFFLRVENEEEVSADPWVSFLDLVRDFPDWPFAARLGDKLHDSWDLRGN
jgi:hypothetical protein